MIEQLSNDDGSLADLLQSYNYQKQLEELKLVSKDYTMDHFQRQYKIPHTRHLGGINAFIGGVRMT